MWFQIRTTHLSIEITKKNGSSEKIVQTHFPANIIYIIYIFLYNENIFRYNNWVMVNFNKGRKKICAKGKETN